MYIDYITTTNLHIVDQHTHIVAYSYVTQDECFEMHVLMLALFSHPAAREALVVFVTSQPSTQLAPPPDARR